MITRDEIESLGWTYKDDEDYYAPRYELPGAIMFPPMRVHRAGVGYYDQPPHLIVMKYPDTLEDGESYYPGTAHDLILIMRENAIAAATGPDIAAETARAAIARRNEECVCGICKRNADGKNTLEDGRPVCSSCEEMLID